MIFLNLFIYRSSGRSGRPQHNKQFKNWKPVGNLKSARFWYALSMSLDFILGITYEEDIMQKCFRDLQQSAGILCSDIQTITFDRERVDIAL